VCDEHLFSRSVLQSLDVVRDALNTLRKCLRLSLQVRNGLHLGILLAQQSLLVVVETREDILHLDELLLLCELRDALIADLDPAVLLLQLALDFVQFANAIIQV